LRWLLEWFELDSVGFGRIKLILRRYGVVRVFSQQCEYVLSDVQGTRDRMRGMLKAMRTAELDPEAGKARYVPYTSHNYDE
jgi:hypothetical protein